MKKKKHDKSKVKKKISYTSGKFNRLFRKQFATNYKAMNLISFIKRFRFFNLTAGYSILALLGIRQSNRMTIFDNRTQMKHRSVIRKIIVLKFYFNRNLVKQKKFELLKTLVTFKSFRFYFSFPMRGQRTKTNAKTRKKRDVL